MVRQVRPITCGVVSTATDYKKIENKIISGIRSYFQNAGYENAVIGLSGGLDSTTACLLTAKALGEQNVHGIILPAETTPRNDVEDALLFARELGINHYIFNISDIANAFVHRLHHRHLLPNSNVTRGNIAARARMTALYNVAQRTRSLVVGTGDRSELLLGYFTKYGDGGADILPLGSLYKTEVRALAKSMHIPPFILNKPSSPNLWHGQTAAEELGADYGQIDPILQMLVDKKMNEKSVARKTKNAQLVAKISSMIKKSEHKRKTPFIVRA